MLRSRSIPDLFYTVNYMANLFLEKPFHTYNPMLFAGVLCGKPLALWFAMMMPLLPIVDMRAPVTKSKA